MSGHRQESDAHVRCRLRELGYPELDFYYGRRAEDMPFNGAVRKSQVIRDENIDLHFDDYDFDHPDTARLFRELGQEHRIARIRSTERRDWSRP